MSHMKRREFLHRSLCAAVGSGLFQSMLPKLALAQGAISAPKAADYRALVCIYLYGGNDSFNTVVPMSGAARTQYVASRPSLALPTAGLQTLTPLSGSGFSDGAGYGLHPAMPGLRDLFNSGRAALIANVGPLIRPLSLSDYQNAAIPRPAQLFSHADQAVLWQTPRADQFMRSGWGGRLADLLESTTAQSFPICMSLDGEAVFTTGDSTSAYFMGTQGAEQIGRLGDDRLRNTLNSLLAQSYTHPFERAYAGKVQRAIQLPASITAALQSSDRNAGDDGFSDDAYQPMWVALGLNWNRADGARDNLPGLAAQLLMIARLIRARALLGNQSTTGLSYRQIFFAGMGGYDTHDNHLGAQSNLLPVLSQSIKGFFDVINAPAINLANRVTTFTASDFGRTLSSNGDGTDHGWGGHHFVVGGSVRGQRVYGQMPHLGLTSNPNNAGWGQVIPTLSSDQYAATLATWFGLGASDRATLFPNLVNMTGPNIAIQGHDLGFMNVLP